MSQNHISEQKLKTKASPWCGLIITVQIQQNVLYSTWGVERKQQEMCELMWCI